MTENIPQNPSIFWDNHIKKFKASKLTKREYCEANGLNPKSLTNQIYFRNKKAKLNQQIVPEDTGFIKAVINNPVETKEKAKIAKKVVARLITRSGMVLEFDTEISPEWIGAILKTAERI